jgi:hypothetical protein
MKQHHRGVAMPLVSLLHRLFYNSIVILPLERISIPWHALNKAFVRTPLTKARNVERFIAKMMGDNMSGGEERSIPFAPFPQHF